MAAAQYTGQMLRDQQPVGVWSGTVVESIVRLVQANGGQVVFYAMPMSSLFQRAYDTPTRRADSATFARQAQVWGTPLLTPDFHYDDRDFPDR